MSRLSILTDTALCRRLCAQITQAVPTCWYAGHTVHVQNLNLTYLPRGGHMPWHQHAQYEGIVMVAGLAWETTEGRQALSPGTLLLHEPNQPHRWEAPDAVGRLLIGFTLTPALPVPRPSVWPVSPAAVEGVEALLNTARAATPGWQERAAAHLVLLFADLLASATWSASAYEPPGQPLGDIAPLVEQFLCDNLAHSLTLRDIAGQVGMSVPTLTRHFHREVGVTIMERLEALRMEEAAHLLTETSLTAAAIGAKVGLHEPSYFCRRFHRYMGLTPQQYRKYQQSIHGNYGAPLGQARPVGPDAGALTMPLTRNPSSGTG